MPSRQRHRQDFHSRGVPTGSVSLMRLSIAQTEMILHCVRGQLGADAQVMLFGSRLDDTARGGDVDLLVESAAPVTLRQRALMTLALENAMGLPVDIVTLQCGTPGSAFARIARSQALLLESAA